MIDRDPEFAEAYALKGANGSMIYWFFYDRSDSIIDASRQLIERSLELQPGLPEGHAALGHWYYRTQLDYDQALRELEIAIEARPSDAGFETTLASVYRRAGDMESALEHFEIGVELDPRSAMAPYSVGETLILLRRYDEAKPWLRRAMEVRPDFAYPYQYMSMVAVRAEGDTAGARLWLRRMRERALTRDVAEYNLVDLDLLAVRPDSENLDQNRERVLETVRGFDGPLSNQFRFVPLSLLSGRVRLQMGDPAGAAAAFDSARTELSALVAQYPEEAAYRSSLGLALAGLRLDDEAIAEAREGLRLMPPEVEAWRGSWRAIDLARVYAMTGRNDEAIEQLEYVMSIPADLSAWELRLDPTWDPLRGDPRFEALTAVD